MNTCSHRDSSCIKMNWKTIEANCWNFSSKLPGSGKWMWDSKLWQPCKNLSTFPSVSHSVTAGHDSLFVIVFAACMRWAGLSPCPGILLPSCICETFRFFVSFIWHLSSCFISICSFFSSLSPAAQKQKPEAYRLLFTNQPHIFFSSCTQVLVRKKIPLEPGKNFARK